MDVFLSILMPFISVVVTGIGGYVAQAVIEYIKSKTKNENLTLALEFARQAVIKADQLEGSGSDKAQEAQRLLYQRLSENGKAKNFTQEQMSQVIESAFQFIKKAGNQ